MKNKKIVIDNFISLAFLQGVTYILPLVTFPFLVRVLGPVKYGLVTFSQCFIMYFVLLIDYGFNYSATREISIYRNDIGRLSGIVASVTAIKLLLLAVSFAVFSCVLFLAPKFSSEKTLYYFSFLAVLGNVLMPAWFFMGIEKMNYIMYLSILSKVIYTVCIFVFITGPEGYLLVPLFNGLGGIFSGLIAIYVLFKTFKIRPLVPRISEIARQLKEGWHVFISTMAISAYSNTRMFAVGLLCSETVTGYYAIAEKLINIIQSTYLIPLAQTVFPRLSNVFHADPGKAFNMMRRLQSLTTMLYLLFLPPLFILAPHIISLIAKNVYPETLLSFRILLIAAFFTSANAFRVQFLLISGRNKIYADIHMLAGTIGVVLTFLFAYLYSYIGPPFSMLIVEITVLLLTVISVRQSCPDRA
ncbi:MAG TPA: flippase [Candidatus Omnitrophota bacterium]|nr:flippase [Candidatus Omnitrophota bacterium]